MAMVPSGCSSHEIRVQYSERRPEVIESRTGGSCFSGISNPNSSPRYRRGRAGAVNQFSVEESLSKEELDEVPIHFSRAHGLDP